MKLEEIRGLATEELAKTEVDAREEMFKLRYAQATESVENTRVVRELRKRIARIQTVVRERELKAAREAASTAAAPAAGEA
jgi:large subunit ribosomal protein L29